MAYDIGGWTREGEPCVATSVCIKMAPVEPKNDEGKSNKTCFKTRANRQRKEEKGRRRKRKKERDGEGERESRRKAVEES